MKIVFVHAPPFVESTKMPDFPVEVQPPSRFIANVSLPQKFDTKGNLPANCKEKRLQEVEAKGTEIQFQGILSKESVCSRHRWSVRRGNLVLVAVQ